MKKYDHVILGGTGHIGSELVKKLLHEKESVLIIGHHSDQGEKWRANGAAYETADILDEDGLKELFGQASRVFILNPPAPPNTDIDQVERKQIRTILNVLKSLKLKKVVAISTYGAQQGDHLFDLGTLYELEQGLYQLEVPVAIIRAAYYMSNFDQSLSNVKERGELVTLFPVDFRLPMVAPDDVGSFAARLMVDDKTGLFFIEGPEHYSNTDVAQAFSQLLNKQVKVMNIPETGWKEFLISGGFSEPAAASFINMIKLTISGEAKAKDAYHGSTSIARYLAKALKESA